MEYIILLLVIIIIILSVIFCISKVNHSVEKFNNLNVTKSGCPLILENINEIVETELEGNNLIGYKMNEDSSIIIKNKEKNIDLKNYVLSCKFKIENLNENNQLVKDSSYNLNINKDKKLELNGKLINDSKLDLNTYYDLNIICNKPIVSVSVNNKNIITENVKNNSNGNSLILGNNGFNGVLSNIDINYSLLENFNNDVNSIEKMKMTLKKTMVYVKPPVISHQIESLSSCSINWQDKSLVDAFVLFLYKTNNPNEGVTMKVIKYSETGEYKYLLDNLIENTIYSVFVRAYKNKNNKDILSTISNTEVFTPKNTYLHIPNITVPVSKLINESCPSNDLK